LPIELDSSASKQFREQLREAREYALKDAEAFDGIIHVIERLGSFLLGEVASLGPYHKKLKPLAAHSALSGEIPNLWRDFHTPFSQLYWMLTTARNDAMHMGASARHITTHAIELALILEDALNMNEELNAKDKPKCISDYMVRDITLAHLWEPVSFVRQKMLANSFSFLPLQNKDNEWCIISDLEIAQFLQGHRKDGRNERLAEKLEKVKNGTPFEPACCHMGNEAIESILKVFNGKPVLVFTDNFKSSPIGILTAFDLL
jgi:hypothetical protein